MIHPHTELRHINDDIGLGVIATRLIPRGTVTWVLDALDFVIEPDAVQALPEPQLAFLERYSYIDPRGRHVLCWDAGRYVNHACDATTAPLGTICDIAVRDILPGEELTTDYAVLMHGTDRPFPCRCTAERCRGEVIPDTGATWWRRAHAAALRRLGEVAQPLLPHVESGAVARALADAGIV
jgi:hypothetical protein